MPSRRQSSFFGALPSFRCVAKKRKSSRPVSSLIFRKYARISFRSCGQNERFMPSNGEQSLRLVVKSSRSASPIIGVERSGLMKSMTYSAVFTRIGQAYGGTGFWLFTKVR